MEGFAAAANVFWSVIIVGLCILWAKIWQIMWLKPRRIRSLLLKQGIEGPKPHFFYGNFQQIKTIQSNFTKSDGHGSSISHSAWVSSISPHLQQWAQQYGPVYLYSIMNQQHLYVGDPELIKAMNLNKSMDLGKPTYNSKSMEPLIGEGIIRANGPYWAHQRKLIAPEFFLNKAKHMLGLMKECTTTMIRIWETQIESNGGVADISADKDLKIVAADIISQACFGSSYSQGKQIFAKLKTLQEAMSKQNIFFGITHFRFLPTKSNKLIWRLQKEVETLILEIVNSRRKKGSAEKDLLQAMLENASNTDDLNLKNAYAYKIDKIIVDNCKNIYFAGHETTALTASWCLMLLALYPEWQQRIRTEILDICGDKISECLLDLDKLRQLKTLNMVIQETLRLYGPGVLTTREVFSDMKFGNITVPKGTNIWVFNPILHRDSENWGADANEFRPERFSGSMAESCKHPQLFVPFGFGNRLCIGQTFATLQLKIVVSLLVSNFNFAVSPEYRHCPVNQMVLVPQDGIRLLVTKVNGN